MMKKYISFLGVLVVGLLFSQKDRIGINTDNPRATLEVMRHGGVPPNQPQGVVFPRLSNAERDGFDVAKLTEGLMIYNTDKKCIDMWNGARWSCLKRENPIIPLGLTILEGERIFVSVYDDDYLPYNGPVGAALLTSRAADGTPDRLIDVQGKITTTGVEVYIPVKVTQSVTLPASQIQVPVEAQFTEDGISRNVSLSWEAQNLNTWDHYVKARIKSVGGTLNLKKLDFNSGLGTNYRGHLIARFTYNSTLAGTQKVNYDLRLMPGIPDRKLSVQTNGKYEHDFIYVPMYDPLTRRIWLNNNLGANYTNIDSPVFDPGQQAKHPDDHNAMGSLFQWGRDSNGHELIDFHPITNKATKRYGFIQRNLVANDPMTEVQTIIPMGDALNYYYYPATYQVSKYYENTNGSTSNNKFGAICPIGFRVTHVSDYNGVDRAKFLAPHSAFYWIWLGGGPNGPPIQEYPSTYSPIHPNARSSSMWWVNQRSDWDVTVPGRRVEWPTDILNRAITYGTARAYYHQGVVLSGYDDFFSGGFVVQTPSYYSGSRAYSPTTLTYASIPVRCIKN